MPCDGGSRLLVLGGFHHSGTGIITHALKVRALGNGGSTSQANQLVIDSEIRDRWPPTHGPEMAALNCTDMWSIWKHPTNSAHEVAHFLALRNVWPRMTLVFVERDAPNAVWSLMKRFRSWRADNIASHLGHYCDVWHSFHARKQPHVHFVDLQNFSSRPRCVLCPRDSNPRAVAEPPPCQKAHRESHVRISS